ncbi:MAG: FecCD family ABC transporter permease [Tepidisphaerales bacterium]
MKAWTAGRWLKLATLSALAWAAVAGACLLIGSTGVGWPTAVQLGPRLEVVLLGSLVGAALAAAGVTYQCVLRNPLADPYLLGVASGATLGTLLWRWPGLADEGVVLLAGQPAMALAGALLMSALVLAVSSRTRGGRLDPVTVVLVGVVVSSLCSAVVLLLLSLRPELLAGGGGLAGVLVGALQTNLTPGQAVVSAAIVVAGWAGLVLLTPAMAVSMLGDSEALSLGLHLTRLRYLALALAAVVVAAAVAVSGPIGFVGLICPHIGRLLVGADPRRLLPVATAAGACLLTAADALCRGLSMPHLLGTLLPVGVVTALLGGPFFLYLLARPGGVPGFPADGLSVARTREALPAADSPARGGGRT